MSQRLSSPWSGRRVAGSGTQGATRGSRVLAEGRDGETGSRRGPGRRPRGWGFSLSVRSHTLCQQWFSVPEYSVSPQVSGEGRSSPSPSGTGGRLATRPDRPFPGGACSALEADGPSLLCGPAMPAAGSARCSLRHGRGRGPVPLLLARPWGPGPGPLDKGPSPSPLPWSAPLSHGHEATRSGQKARLPSRPPPITAPGGQRRGRPPRSEWKGEGVGVGKGQAEAEPASKAPSRRGRGLHKGFSTFQVPPGAS